MPPSTFDVNWLKSSHNGFLDVGRSNGGLRISGWIGQLSCCLMFVWLIDWFIYLLIDWLIDWLINKSTICCIVMLHKVAEAVITPWQLPPGTSSTMLHKSTSSICSRWTSSTNTDDALIPVMMAVPVTSSVLVYVCVRTATGFCLAILQHCHCVHYNNLNYLTMSWMSYQLCGEWDLHDKSWKMIKFLKSWKHGHQNSDVEISVEF